MLRCGTEVMFSYKFGVQAKVMNGVFVKPGTEFHRIHLPNGEAVYIRSSDIIKTGKITSVPVARDGPTVNYPAMEVENFLSSLGK